MSVETLDDFDYPEHFFRVEIDGVNRHSAGVLLNREAVQGYIAEVCPVPFAPTFPFSKNIHAIFLENGNVGAKSALDVTGGFGESVDYPVLLSLNRLHF